MVKRYSFSHVVLLVVALFVSIVACMSAGQAQTPTEPVGSSPEVTEPPAPTALVAPSATPALEAVPVDVCALVSPEEVQQILGQQVAPQFYAPYISCDYMVSISQGMSITVGKGDAAKSAFILVMEDLVKVTGNGEVAVQTLEQLKQEQSALTLQQLFEEAFPLYESVGYTVTKQDDPGETAYFMWWEQYKFGQVVAFRDENTWLLIGTRPLDPATAQTTMTGLVTNALGKLPEAFTIAGVE
jgi:hypothetical protein